MKLPTGILILLIAGTTAPGISANGKSQRVQIREDPAAPKSYGRAIEMPDVHFVRIESAFYMVFPESDDAVVVQYETKVPIKNKPALARQADRVVQALSSTLKKHRVKSAVLRAVHYTSSGPVRSGKGFGFVYELSSDGRWKRNEPDRGGAV